MDKEGDTQQSSVKMVCPEDGVELGTTEETATVFYIALPPQTYTKGFSITLTDIYGRSFTKTAFTSEGFTLERNHIKPMEALQVAFGENELKIVKGEDGNQYAEVNTYEALLKWGYTVNKINKSLGMKLLNDIEMPDKTIEEDLENKTYKVTDTDITVTDGVPSGSNWIPICVGYEDKKWEKAYSEHIDGQNHSITGLRVLQENTQYVGFIAAMYDDSSVKDLTLSNAVIEGGNETGAIVGRAQNGICIENVHVTNSNITGKEEVGGIAGRNYCRKSKSEKLSYIKNCETDEYTTVTSDKIVGGICGNNYGAVIIKCTNNVNVSGQNMLEESLVVFVNMTRMPIAT